jgi:predicted RNA-binding protein associated with RNAse of E/G family
VNLAAPMERTSRGIDTLDHQLDIWVWPDGSWNLKDEDLFEREIEMGRWAKDESDAIRAEASRVIADVEAGQPWWDEEWASWEPDPSRKALELPDGWEAS